MFSLLGETDPAARRDYWDGGLATQALVFAIAWGTEEEADLVETIATEMFAPISQCHRITVEQMALLEPAHSETLINGCIEVITQGLQKVIDLGVPETAAKDFCMGHMQISIALLFEELNWKLSDGALIALKTAQGSRFRDDWLASLRPWAIEISSNVLAGYKTIQSLRASECEKASQIMDWWSCAETTPISGESPLTLAPFEIAIIRG